MFFCGELALVHKNSSEEVKDWLGTFPRNQLSAIEGQDVEFCFLSMDEQDFGGWVGGNSIGLYSGFPSSPERMDIDLDFNDTTVRWTCKSADPPISFTCPIPKRPFFVLFNTGAVHAGAEFLNFKNYRYAKSWQQEQTTWADLPSELWVSATHMVCVMILTCYSTDHDPVESGSEGDLWMSHCLSEMVSS